MAATRSGRSRRRSSRGQAITETVLMMWGLMLLLAIMIQAFLIDLHVYRLATAAHARLFNDVAYPGNRPTVAYDASRGARLEGADEYVPVIGYFAMYGLTREDLRIRTIWEDRRDRHKQIRIGRGTGADVASGLEGALDPSPWLSQLDEAMSQIQTAQRQAQDWLARTAGSRGR